MTNSQNKNEQNNILLEELDNLEKASYNSKVLSVSATGKTRYIKRRRTQQFNYKRFKNACIILLILVIIVSSILISYHLLNNNNGKKELLAGNKEASIELIDNALSDDEGNTVIYKGETYRFNKDLISIVLMGIDKSTLGTDIFGEAGQADAVYIFTYDTNSSKCTLIPVSRETMTEVKLRSTSGQEMGLETMQLCLSYAYGDGKDVSCINTLESLSRIFYNLPFTNYIAMNWDAIAPLNDAIGGITLTSIEDVHTQYGTIDKDEYITLNGYEAWSYVKYRDTSKLNSNADRLKRQEHYIKEFVAKLIPLAEYEPTIISKLFDAAGEYMYSNMTDNKLTYIASDILPNIYSAKDINFVTIAGETKQGEEYAEFYPDETALYETILRVFYLKDIE